MKFFGREVELKELRKVREFSLEKSRFTVLTGRRRVGKTELSREAFDDGKTPYVNLPITRQPEVTLCAQLQDEVENEIDIVCEDEVSGSLGFYEVKVDPSRFDAARLDEKVAAFFAKNPERRSLVRKSALLSLSDM